MSLVKKGAALLMVATMALSSAACQIVKQRENLKHRQK